MGFEDDNFMDDEFDVNELVDRFESMIRQDKSCYFDADELNVILEHYLQQDNIKKANMAADIALKFHPNNPMIQIIKAKQLLANSHAQEALSTLKNATVDKEDADYQITLGSCYSDLGESKKAINAYMKAVKAFDYKECEDLFNFIAIEYENLGDINKALEFFIKGLNRNIDLDNQYFEIRNCYSMLNRMDDAIDFFKKEIDLNPYSVEAWMALSNCYIRLNRLDDAIEQLEYVLAIDPHNKKAYSDIATAYNETGRFKETLGIVDEATRYNAESPLLLCLNGEACAKLGDITEAMRHYKKAMKLNENLPEAYAGIGFILSDENNPQSAIKFLKHAHTLAPNNTDYMFVLAEEYNKLNDYDKAIKIVLDIIDIDPYDENAYIALMECYVLKDDPENAFVAINRGLATLGNNAPLLYRKAFLHFAENENESGLLTLEMALNLDYDGHIEFLNFDAESLTNNESVMELIEEYRIKNKNNTIN